MREECPGQPLAPSSPCPSVEGRATAYIPVHENCLHLDAWRVSHGQSKASSDFLLGYIYIYYLGLVICSREMVILF